jgi:hypothetical protein
MASVSGRRPTVIYWLAASFLVKPPKPFIFDVNFYNLKQLFFFLLFVVSTTTGLAQYERIMSLDYPQRGYALDSIRHEFTRDTNVVKFTQALENIRQSALEKRDEKALLHVKMGYYIIQDYGVKDYDLQSKMLDTIIAEAEKADYPAMLATAHVYMGWLCTVFKKYAKCFEHFLKAYDILLPMRTEDMRDRNYFFYSMGLNYYKFKDYAQAITITKNAEFEPQDVYNNMFKTDLIGMCYLKMGAYDSARTWLEKTLYFAKKPTKGLLDWQGIALGNIGQTWYLQNNFGKAIPYLEEGIQLTKENNSWGNAADFACYLSDIYLQSGNLTKAREVLELAKTATFFNQDDDTFYKLYKVMGQYNRKTGNYAAALANTDSMLYYEQKRAIENDYIQKATAEYEFEKQKRLAEEKRIIEDARQQKWIRNILIALLAVSLIAFFLYFNRKRIKYLYAQKELENEKLKAEEQLHIAAAKLEDFTKSLREKNSIIEKFGEEIEKLQALPCNVVTPEQTEALSQLRRSAILTDEDWESFRENFDKVHTGFLIRLKAKIPDLSPAETRFLALAKLQLSNKEMAALLGVTADAMRLTRFRLRKKLNLTEDGSLEELVNSI